MPQETMENSMTQTVLILGPTGKFGRNATLAFEKAGWSVRRFDRKSDTLDMAARGVDVIVVNDCIALMKRFIDEKPELWAEDIAEDIDES